MAAVKGKKRVRKDIQGASQRSPYGSCMEDYIVFDVETTGLDVKKNRIVQLAMVKVKSNGQDVTWCEYFNPCLSPALQQDGYRFHKISPDMLKEKKEFKSYYHKIIAFINGVRYLVGHNVLFDWNFLQKEFKLQGVETFDHESLKDIVLIDTMKTSISSFPELSKFGLEDLATYLPLQTVRDAKCRKEEISFHDALTDSKLARDVLIACFDKLEISNKVSKSVSLRSLEASYPQFTYPVQFIYLTDKLLNGTLGLDEQRSLLDFAKTFMSTMPSSRGKLLKDIPKDSLRSASGYLGRKGKGINQARTKGLIDLVLKDEI